MADRKRAIVFVAWGETFIAEVLNCIRASTALPDVERILITDQTSAPPDGIFTVIRPDFKTHGHLRKTELFDILPKGYDSFLFLDSDTLVIADIELGFIKAETHGIAVAPAPHYSRTIIDQLMEQEGLSKSGQLLYNSGVLFFSPDKRVAEVFRLWGELGKKYLGVYYHDQPFFTVAMEKLNFNPYTLSIDYNYRGVSDRISGIVRIWHSHTPMPANINQFEARRAARSVVDGVVVFPDRKPRPLLFRLRQSLIRVRNLIRPS
jgi:hypothetical protein